jgi:type IV pilus assembly protein PilZ
MRCPVTPAAVPRQHIRYPVSLRVDYSTRDAFVANHVSNLSKGGLFIASDAPLPVDSELELVLTLAEPMECIKARGRVIWNYDIRKGTTRVIPGMGIKFLDMTPADRCRLAAYLAEVVVGSLSRLRRRRER